MAAIPEDLAAVLALGVPVLPINPTTKRPLISAWPSQASTDAATVASWEATGATGWGARCGTTRDGWHLAVIDLDGPSHGLDLDESIGRACEVFGWDDLPAAPMVLTRGGGAHLWVRTAAPVRNRAVAPGVDLRGEGGFVVVPPTEGWVWVAGRPPTLDDIPEITLDPDPGGDGVGGEAAQKPGEAAQGPSGAAQGPGEGRARPGDLWAERTSWAELLTELGGTHAGVTIDREGHRVELWTRPGKDPRDGHSATVGFGGADRLVVHTTNWPGLPPGSYSKLGVLAATKFGGDFGAAARSLAAQGFVPPEPGPDDITETTDITEPVVIPAVRWVDTYPVDPPPPPEPLITGLLDRGEWTAVAAERGIGKSWAALGLASALATPDRGEFLELPAPTRERVLILHGELTETASAARWMLATAGRPPAGVAEAFIAGTDVGIDVARVRSPTAGGGFVDRTAGVATPSLRALVAEVSPSVLIVDPWVVLSRGAEESNAATEAALSALAEITAGITVILIHHVGKGSDHREPEDSWRGASRLADWAANRITIQRHYRTEREWEAAGLNRLDARRFVRISILRRGAPPPEGEIHARLDRMGRWVRWTPPSD